MATVKRLYRTDKDKMVGGVCAGIAAYAGIDPTLVRIAFVLSTIVTGFIPGIITYLVLYVIMPTKSEVKKHGKKG